MSQKRSREEKRQVVFRRIGGRIVPISIGVAGAAVAADAARTTQIYSKNGVTINKKRFAVQPFVWDKMGTRLEMFNKQGKKVATASYYRGADESAKSFGFSWIGVNKKFRGEGHSKVISKVAAGDIRRQGGEYLFNQVVHPGSLKTNFTRRDTLYKLTEIQKQKKGTEKGAVPMLKSLGKRLRLSGADEGISYIERVGQEAAMRNINWHRSRWLKPKNKLEAAWFKINPTARITSNSNIFRRTSLKGVPYKKLTEVRTLGNKARILVGGVTALGAASYVIGRGGD